MNIFICLFLLSCLLLRVGYSLPATSLQNRNKNDIAKESFKETLLNERGLRAEQELQESIKERSNLEDDLNRLLNVKEKRLSKVKLNEALENKNDELKKKTLKNKVNNDKETKDLIEDSHQELHASNERSVNNHESHAELKNLKRSDDQERMHSLEEEFQRFQPNGEEEEEEDEDEEKEDEDHRESHGHEEKHVGNQSNKKENVADEVKRFEEILRKLHPPEEDEEEEREIHLPKRNDAEIKKDDDTKEKKREKIVATDKSEGINLGSDEKKSKVETSNQAHLEKREHKVSHDKLAREEKNSHDKEKKEEQNSAKERQTGKSLEKDEINKGFWIDKAQDTRSRIAERSELYLPFQQKEEEENDRTIEEDESLDEDTPRIVEEDDEEDYLNNNYDINEEEYQKKKRMLTRLELASLFARNEGASLDDNESFLGEDTRDGTNIKRITPPLHIENGLTNGDKNNEFERYSEPMKSYSDKGNELDDVDDEDDRIEEREVAVRAYREKRIKSLCHSCCLVDKCWMVHGLHCNC